MGRLRVTGLVRTADRLRRDLGHAMPPRKRDEWRALVTAMLAKIDEELALARSSVKDLPAPSQRAYHFLSTLDWGKVATDEGAAGLAPASAQVRFNGLGAFVDRAAGQLAKADTPEKLVQIHASLAKASRRVEFSIAQAGAHPEHMSPATRGNRGWLAFFAELENAKWYAESLKAAGLLVPVVLGQGYRGPVVIQFRPTPYLYKIQYGRLETTVILPTPMIAFDAAGFQLVADLIGRRSRQAKQRLHEAMLTEPYQTVQAELDALGGIPEQSRGVYHDLGKAFERVKTRYFRGKMDRPKLVWSQLLTGRKFGHYDSIRDTVMVSSTLDQASVPEFVVDFLVYHELLHKQLGVRVIGGRRYSHTEEFRLRERRFERYREAEAELERLAGLRPGEAVQIDDP